MVLLPMPMENLPLRSVPAGTVLVITSVGFDDQGNHSRYFRQCNVSLYHLLPAAILRKLLLQVPLVLKNLKRTTPYSSQVVKSEAAKYHSTNQHS